MIPPIISDNLNTRRLDWLSRHVSYLEHDDKNGVSAQQAPRGGWWPQTVGDPESTRDDEFVGLSFIDYIDAQMKDELA